MQEPLLLTINEMQQVTGFKRGYKHKEWFKAHGFSFIMADDGYPRVLREHFKEIMGVKQPKKYGRQPNTKGLREYLNVS